MLRESTPYKSMPKKKQALRQQLFLLLDCVEAEMKAVGFWSDNIPSPEAFKSELPFFYDTMRFEEWVQWVYVARFREVIEANQLPLQGSDVSPMAEECFKGYGQHCGGVIAALRAFDCALS
ncbi:MAG: YqcC family protein [Pseudomonadales bacterium]|nr:YqcC family protein [Pseudomonadales bacterium]